MISKVDALNDEISNHIFDVIMDSPFTSPSYKLINDICIVANAFHAELYDASVEDRLEYSLKDSTTFSQYHLNKRTIEIFIIQKDIVIKDEDVIDHIRECVEIEDIWTDGESNINFKGADFGPKGRKKKSVALVLTLHESLFEKNTLEDEQIAQMKAIKIEEATAKVSVEYPPKDVYSTHLKTLAEQKAYLDCFIKDVEENGEECEENMHPILHYICRFQYPEFFKYFESKFHGDLADIYIEHHWSSYADAFPELLTM